MNEFIPQINRDKNIRKPAYKKPESIKQLERDFFEWKYQNRSTPKNCRFVKKFRDDTANGLSSCIYAWCKINNAHFQRMNTQGQYDAKLNIWRKSGSTKGISDTLIIFQSKTIHIEIKIGKDRQSENQKNIQLSIEHSGGVYWVVQSFDEFVDKMKSLFNMI